MENNKSLSFRISEKLTSWIGSPSSIIVHTIFFIGIFGLVIFDVSFEQILLILTTAVSLEAIYLAIFIQMTVNRHTASLQEVEEEIEDLGEDIEELGEEVEDISEDIEEMSEDIDKIQEEESQDEVRDMKSHASLENIEITLQKLLTDIETIKQKNK